jgi:hypothetical protein
MSGGRRFDRCATTETRDRRPGSRPSYDHRQNALDRSSGCSLARPTQPRDHGSSFKLSSCIPGTRLGVHRGVLGGIMAVRNPAR